ncbi:hypothetical protein G113_01864, partial [Aeromonas molluscorum 848]
MKQILVGALVALVLTGCGKVNRDNYDKLKMGISYSEASAILGKADSCDDALGTTSCIWGRQATEYQDPFHCRQGDLLQLRRDQISP